MVCERVYSTVEVCGSSPHGSTITLNNLERFLRNPTETSPVIGLIRCDVFAHTGYIKNATPRE